MWNFILVKEVWPLYHISRKEGGIFVLVGSRGDPSVNSVTVILSSPVQCAMAPYLIHTEGVASVHIQ